MKRVGILGGTFNPVHIGHLAIAQIAADKLKLDKVYFVPCFHPPHKRAADLVSAEDRLRMVRLAVEGSPQFDVCDFEVKNGGTSYSVDTVTHLRDTLPKGTKLFFIVGGDAISGLKRWRRIGDLLKAATFVAVNRKGFTKPLGAMAVKMLTMSEVDVSSSKIRQRLKAGDSVNYLVPQKVMAYILKNKLYSTQ